MLFRSFVQLPNVFIRSALIKQFQLSKKLVQPFSCISSFPFIFRALIMRNNKSSEFLSPIGMGYSTRLSGILLLRWFLHFSQAATTVCMCVVKHVCVLCVVSCVTFSTLTHFLQIRVCVAGTPKNLCASTRAPTASNLLSTQNTDWNLML